MAKPPALRAAWGRALLTDVATYFAAQSERRSFGNDHRGIHSVDIKRVWDFVNREVIFKGEGQISGQGVHFFKVWKSPAIFCYFHDRSKRLQYFLDFTVSWLRW